MSNRFVRPDSTTPITMLTCYDALTAALETEAGVDILLVGDSLGTNVLGYDSPRSVTLSDMVHHTKAVRRGAPTAFILTDLPYQSYTTPEQAINSANQLIAAGADAVKAEGAIPEICSHLELSGIQVCGHLGFTPQTIDKAAVQAKTADQAAELSLNCLALEASGCFMIVLELVPEEVASLVTSQLAIPTIGIGSGRDTTGQVLVVNDIIGLTQRPMRHSPRYSEIRASIQLSIETFVRETQSRVFPSATNSAHMAAPELESLESLVNPER